MFKQFNKMKRSALDTVVLDSLDVTDSILCTHLEELKAIEVAAAADRKIIIEQLTNINESLALLTKGGN